MRQLVHSVSSAMVQVVILVLSLKGSLYCCDSDRYNMNISRAEQTSLNVDMIESCSKSIFAWWETWCHRSSDADDLLGHIFANATRTRYSRCVCVSKSDFWFDH